MDVREAEAVTERFPVLFTADAKYAPHLAAAMRSLLTHNKDIPLRVVVLEKGLGQDDIRKLTTIALRFDTPIEVFEIDSHHLGGLVVTDHFSTSNYFRLFAADYIEDQKCLYLDSDLVINGSILGLISTELEDYYLAAVENPGPIHSRELGMSPDSKYFNSGVMLINLEVWRDAHLREKTLAFARQNPEAILFADQCALNAVIDGQWVELPEIFNSQASLIGPGLTGERDLNGAIVIHFSGSGKPWQMNYRHPKKRIYWYHRNRTPYWSLIPEDFGPRALLRSMVPDSLAAWLRGERVHPRIFRRAVGKSKLY